MIARLALAIALMWFGAPSLADGALPRRLLAEHFPGLQSAGDRLGDAALDYELDRAAGGTLHFERCSQVAAIGEGEIAAPQVPLFTALRLNCLAAKRFDDSRAARRSHFPGRLSPRLVLSLPAATLPRWSDSAPAPAPGRTLAQLGARVARVDTQGVAHLRLADEDALVVVLARADFDGDGFEDLLLRVDAAVRGGSGRGSALAAVTRTRADGAVALLWRAP